MDCQNLGQTILALECYGSSPLQPDLDSKFSADVLDTVLDDGGNIFLVSASIPFCLVHSRHPGLMGLSLEECLVFTDLSGPLEGHLDCNLTGGATTDAQQKSTSLRKLSLSGEHLLPTHTLITAPNLVHLSLKIVHPHEMMHHHPMHRSILNMLGGCLQLETALISMNRGGDNLPQSPNPVTLPKLRGIELGHFEMRENWPS
jgi:hypothetical protein